jgi:hemerythrin
MPATTAEYMKWSESFSVGHPGIDAQHKKLVSLLNELCVAMGSGRSSSVLGTILEQLVNYTKEHFRAEEVIMKEAAFPGFAAHKLEHDALAGKILKLQSELRAGTVGISIELLDFLKDWLTHHILESDKKYAPFVKVRGN